MQSDRILEYISTNLGTLVDLYSPNNLSINSKLQHFHSLILGFKYYKNTRREYTYPSKYLLKNILTTPQANMNITSIYSISYTFNIPLQDFVLHPNEFRNKVKKEYKPFQKKGCNLNSSLVKKTITNTLNSHFKNNAYNISKTTNNKYIFELTSKKQSIIPTLKTLIKLCLTYENLISLLAYLDLELKLKCKY